MIAYLKAFFYSLFKTYKPKDRMFNSVSKNGTISPAKKPLMAKDLVSECPIKVEALDVEADTLHISGTKWSDADEIYLITEWQKNRTVSDIAKDINRSESSTRAKLLDMGMSSRITSNRKIRKLNSWQIDNKVYTHLDYLFPDEIH